jgi:hypothetical protein
MAQGAVCPSPPVGWVVHLMAPSGCCGQRELMQRRDLELAFTVGDNRQSETLGIGGNPEIGRRALS